MNSGRSIPITIVFNLLLMGIGIVTGSLTARLLGPTGRGELAAVQNWAGFVALIAAVGLPDALVYYSGKYSNKSGIYLASAIFLAILLAAPFIVIGYQLAPILLAAQSNSTIGLAQNYLAIFILLQATQGMLLHPLRGLSDFNTWNVLRSVYPVGWLIVILISCILNLYSVEFFVVGYLVVLGVLSIPTFFIVLKRIIGPFRIKIHTWKPLLKFGIPSVTSAVPQALNYRLDQMILAAFLAPAFLGYYAVAVTWSSGISPFLLGIAVVVFPTIARKTSNQDQHESLAKTIRISSFIAFSLVIMLLILTPVGILFLFGNEFTRSIPVALILVVASGISGFSMVLVEGLRGLGMPQRVIVGEVVGLLFTIISLLFLLPRLNILGAAISSLIGYSVTAVLMLFQIHRATENPINLLLYPTKEDLIVVKKRIINLVGNITVRFKA